MLKIILGILFMISNIAAQPSKVYVVLFTHIEDNLPAGTMGSEESKQSYLNVRAKLIDMAKLAKQYSCAWVFQPDWKFIQATLLYDDSLIMQSTNNKNLFKYLQADLQVVIDAHSHEKMGYNYTDVAHLLDSVGVVSTTVIGGHVWDPTLAQFQNWDRFRVPVQGIKYSHASWRGDILMGSGTPNHINESIVSGVWRPKDNNNYFTDDPSGNIVCIGQYNTEKRLSGVADLIKLYSNGTVSADKMLTASYHIKPGTITAPNGITSIEDTIIKPFTTLRDSGSIVLTDFTSLVNTWKTAFNGTAFIYKPPTPILAESNASSSQNLSFCQKHGVRNTVVINIALNSAGFSSLYLYNPRGRKLKTLFDKGFSSGNHSFTFDTKEFAQGVYICRFVSKYESKSLVFVIEK